MTSSISIDIFISCTSFSPYKVYNIIYYLFHCLQLIYVLGNHESTQYTNTKEKNNETFSKFNSDSGDSENDAVWVIEDISNQQKSKKKKYNNVY